MDGIALADVAFPAFWLFLVGFVLSLGVARTHRAGLDVRDDWTRLVRFHEVLRIVEAARGRDTASRTELAALATALDDAVGPPAEAGGLAARVAGFDPGPQGEGVDPGTARRIAAALDADVVAVDRALQQRMKAAARTQGRFGRLFLAGTGGILLVPLFLAQSLGLMRRWAVRNVEESLWFQAAVAVVLFALLAGTGYALRRVVQVALRYAANFDGV